MHPDASRASPFGFVTGAADFGVSGLFDTYDRDEAMPHYYYAVALEYLMQRAAQEGRQIPESFFAAPKYGKTEYSMRHPLLKPKPRH